MLNRIGLLFTVIGLLSVTAFADKVTFQNRTTGELLVRCISGGNVDPQNEYREMIQAGDSHFRPDFAKGTRAAVAWNSDRSKCTTIVFQVKDGMNLIISETPDGKIEFQKPCANCAGSSSVKIDVPESATQLASRRRGHSLEYSVACLFAN